MTELDCTAEAAVDRVTTDVLSRKAMFCRNCGAPTDASAQFCIRCGASLTPVEGEPPPISEQDPWPQGAPPPPPPPPPYGAFPPEPKQRLVAGLLGILLGVIGVHRFYLGYNTIGAIQLALGLLGFATCGVTSIASAIWGIIDGVMILTGAIRTDAQGIPLRD